jgi:uncharacterized membrane protein
MSLAEWLGFRAWVVVIDLAAAVVITGYAAAAVIRLVRTRDVNRARLVMADGVVSGLGVLVVATLLTTIVLQTWSDIGLFAVIFGLRTLLRRLFDWEKERLTRRPLRTEGR